MAAQSGKEAVHAVTLTANVADTVTFTGSFPFVEVVTDGAAALYVRTDGLPATVAGDLTWLLPAVPSVRVMSVFPYGSTISLISSGTPTYWIMARRRP